MNTSPIYVYFKCRIHYFTDFLFFFLPCQVEGKETSRLRNRTTLYNFSVPKCSLISSTFVLYFCFTKIPCPYALGFRIFILSVLIKVPHSLLQSTSFQFTKKVFELLVADDNGGPRRGPGNRD
jgi:hypothetical protein